MVYNLNNMIQYTVIEISTYPLSSSRDTIPYEHHTLPSGILRSNSDI